jgi:DNA-binding transcriptional ArsR family regulator
MMSKTVKAWEGRPLTEAEVERLRSIPFASAPPWTTERMIMNAVFRRAIAELYLDGVSTPALAEAVGMKPGAMSQHILKARRAGLLSSPRRVVTRASRRAVKPLKHRPLTHGEGDVLRYYYGNVKMMGGRSSRWEGPAAEGMIDYMRWLRLDGVTLESIGGAIGVTRERVRQILRSVEVSPLPDA